MKVVRISGATALAALAVGAFAPSAALSALPEAGKCTEVEPGKGAWANNTCTKRATSSTRPGSWEFKALEATEDIEFGGPSNEVKLITSGHPTIRCKSSGVGGRYTGAKTALVKWTFHECTNPIAQTCQTNPSEAGVIEAAPLEGELGFIKNEVVEGKIKVSVGMDLKPQPPLTDVTTYTCGASAESAAIAGSAIAKYKEIDKMTRAADLYFSATGSQQIPQAFQGGAPDTLTTTYTPSLTSAPTGLKTTVLGSTNSPVTTNPEYEVKAFER
jgi:hypothetical protein